MGWRTEEAGVSRLVERAFWHPRSINGETEGGRELRGNLQTLPPSKILDILRVGGRTVMSGVPNVGGIDSSRAHG